MCGTDNYPPARLCHRQPPVPLSGIGPLAGWVPTTIIPNEFGFPSVPPVPAVAGPGGTGGRFLGAGAASWGRGRFWEP